MNVTIDQLTAASRRAMTGPPGDALAAYQLAVPAVVAFIEQWRSELVLLAEDNDEDPAAPEFELSALAGMMLVGIELGRDMPRRGGGPRDGLDLNARVDEIRRVIGEN